MKSKSYFMLLLLLFTFSASVTFGQNCGDINGDSSTNIVDALLLSQCYVGLISCPSADIGDVNCDGQVNIVDALLVAQLYVGLISQLNCCGTVTPTPSPTTPPGSSGIFGNTPDGFASLNGGTTGGEGGQTVTVTNQSDLEQYAGASEPYIIKVQGTITISPSGFEVSIASNKTIVGVGSDATIKNGGFRIINNQNVILRNLTVRDGSGSDSDGLQTDGARNIWVNHVHFTNFSDGVMDIRKDTSYFTASWCFFTDNNRGPTFGWTDVTDSKVTMHHCLIRNTVKRNPVFDQGFGHFYNNYSVNVSSFGHQARGNAKMVVENSYWDNVNNPYGARDSNSILEVRGSIVINSSGTQETQGGFAFDPSSYYSYTLDPTEDVPDLILNYAGPSDQIQY